MDGSAAKATTYLGTLMYMSPERVEGSGYGFNSDVWSLGLSLMTCAMGDFPLPLANGYWGLAHAIRDAPLPGMPRAIPGPLADCVSLMARGVRFSARCDVAATSPVLAAAATLLCYVATLLLLRCCHVAAVPVYCC